MPRELIFPATVMSLAFVFYTLGVWAERAARSLRAWHVVAFWLGWFFDAYGTLLMNGLRTAGRVPSAVHSVTGASAFALMGAHALWASWVLSRGSDELRSRFHRYSVAVWAVWLVPYLGGMVAGILGGQV